MEAWNRVQGPPGGDAEGEELIHERHEGTRSLAYHVRGGALPHERTNDRCQISVRLKSDAPAL
jgi:hypothetical protein